jgi:hypothetical protein
MKIFLAHLADKPSDTPAEGRQAGLDAADVLRYGMTISR